MFARLLHHGMCQRFELRRDLRQRGRQLPNGLWPRRQLQSRLQGHGCVHHGVFRFEVLDPGLHGRLRDEVQRPRRRVPLG